MNAETYEVVSFEELEQSKKDRNEVIYDYSLKHKNYLLTCLNKTGLANVRVKVKKTGVNGVLLIRENSGSLMYPYEIRFYPIKRDGSVSLVAKSVSGFYGWNVRTLCEMLSNVFEVEKGTKL